MSGQMNREQWLTELAKQVEPVFRGFKIEPYRLTCGWPSRFALGAKARRVGECHYPTANNGVHDIFISPLLAESLEVAGTVVHEMAHVAAGLKAGHSGMYVKVCRHIGLIKNKPTNAMPGKALEDSLRKLVDKQGQYPHTAIELSKKKLKPPSSVSLHCPGCECKVLITLKWLSEAGAPTCGCGERMEIPDA